MPKISQLESATDVTANDLIQVVDVEDDGMAPSGTNKKISAQTLGNYLPVISTGSTTSRSLKDRFADTVNVKDFGAKGDGITDDTASIQAAIDSKYPKGGVVYIPSGKYKVSSTIVLPQNIYIVGDGAGYNNLYSSTDFKLYGSILELAAGSNMDVVNATYIPRAGEPIPTGPDDVRHQGGIVGICIHGNKSANQSVNAVDLNNLGNGIIIKGVSNVIIDRVLCVRCAENGIYVGSYDYGGGVISPNNMMWGNVQSLGNAGNGFSLSGGDQQYGVLTGGYNGGSGILYSGGNSAFSKVLTWNNASHGIYFLNAQATTICSSLSYDNKNNGILVSSCEQINIIGSVFKNNGRDSSALSINRCGIRLSTALSNVVISGVSSYDDSDGTQQYGLYSSDAGNTVNLGSINSFGNSISNISGITNLNTQLHADLGSSQPKHPGFIAESSIDLNNNSIYSYRYIGSLDSAPTESSGVLNVNRSDNAFTPSAPVNITDIAAGSLSTVTYPRVLIRNASSSNSFTLVHNSSKIRCPGAINLVINPFEAVELKGINNPPTIWQVIK